MPLDTKFSNPFDDLGSADDSFLPRVDILTKEGRLVAVDAGGANVANIQIGTLIALDTGHGTIDREQFKPRYRIVSVPIGTPLPPPPAGEEWSPSTRFQVQVDGLDGVRLLRIRGQIQLRRFKAAVQLFNYRPEAAEGKIPLYKFLGFDEVSTDYGNYYGILLEYVGAIDRDEGVFGPRIVPPPPPILPAGPRPQMLPPAAVVETPEDPTEPEAAPQKPVVDETPAAPKVDLFSAFRPVSPAPAATSASAPSPAPSPTIGKKASAKKPY
jgi:hypothetical protein